MDKVTFFEKVQIKGSAVAQWLIQHISQAWNPGPDSVPINISL